MRYCATCELPVEAMLSRPGDWTELAPQGGMPEPATLPPPRQTADQAFAAPFPTRDFLPPWNAPPGAPGSGDPRIAAQAGPQFSPPTYSPQPQARGRRRAGLVVALLVILLVLGGGGYLVLSLLGGHFPRLVVTQAPITTKNLHLTFPYAGLDVTLLTVQQAQNLLDDPHSADDGMLRLNLQEQNKTTVAIHYDYTTSAHLLVRGQPLLAPTSVRSDTTIAPGATATSVVDFAVPGAGNLSALVFQLGASNEAQLQIPLVAQASLSQYQARTTAQHSSVMYFGLNWRLTSSTASLSIPGQQATKGMEFLKLEVKVGNPLSQEAISGSPFDYLRVRAGGQTAAPISTTIPVSFAVGATGKTGTATFLIPQKSTICTLILLSQDPGGSGQASTDFQL
jgi:hypothetical protein